MSVNFGQYFETLLEISNSLELPILTTVLISVLSIVVWEVLKQNLLPNFSLINKEELVENGTREVNVNGHKFLKVPGESSGSQREGFVFRR
jgi:hypothetical protein